MRLWILFGCGVLILGAAIWPLRSPKPPAMPHVAPAVAAQPPQVESPKPVPAKLIEVIDLARAYEPVREPEEPAGAVNPASLIQVPDGPRRIPAAVVDGDEIEVKVASASGIYYERIDPVQRLDVMPREVIRIGNGLLDFVPTPRLVFTPMGVPYATDITQPIPPNAVIQNGLLNFTPTDNQPTVGRLDVMPREVK
jgi:hypothetical protein